MNNHVYVTPTLLVHIENLKRAKAAMADWEAYKLDVEGKILEEVKAQGVSLPASGSIEVGEDLQIICSNRRDWIQGCLAEFVGRHPDQVGSVLMQEWKPASKEKVDAFLSSLHPGAEELKRCFNEKAVKPSMRTK